jgi:hypothetical protein
MNDSFADLCASTTPSNLPTLALTPHPNTTSTPPPPKSDPTYDKPDLFALLLSSSSTATGGSSPSHYVPGSGRFMPCWGCSYQDPLHGGGAAFSDLYRGYEWRQEYARLALENQRQQLNAGRSSNAGLRAREGIAGCGLGWIVLAGCHWVDIMRVIGKRRRRREMFGVWRWVEGGFAQPRTKNNSDVLGPGRLAFNSDCFPLTPRTPSGPNLQTQIHCETT